MPINFNPIYIPRRHDPQSGQQEPTGVTGPAALPVEFAKGIPSFFMRMGEAALGTAEAIVPGDYITPWIENVQSARERAFPMPEDAWGWVGRTAGEALPFLAASAASYGATNSLAGPFLTAFTIEGGTAYNNAKASGASEWQAKGEGALVGTINGSLEMLEIPAILRFAKSGKGSAKALVTAIKHKALKEAGGEVAKITGSILKSAIVEGIQESMQEGASIAVPALISGRFPKNPDGSVNWTAIINQIGMSGLGGAIAGGFFTGAGSLASGLSQSTMPTQAEIKRYRKFIENSDLKETDKIRTLRMWDDEWGKVTPAEEDSQLYIPKEQENVYRGKDTGKVYHEPFNVKEGESRITKMETVPVGQEDAATSETGVFYHGSPKTGLTKILPSMGDYGKGVYFTVEEKKAIEYSKGRKNLAAFVLGDTKIEPKPGTVYKIQPNLKNPLIIESEKQYAGIEAAAEKAGFDIGQAHPERGMADYAKSSGHDGIINTISGEGIAFTEKAVPITEPETRTRIVSIETGEELEQAPDLHRQRGESEEDYAARITAAAKIGKETLAYDDIFTKLNEQIDSVIAKLPEEKQAMSTEKGKRFQEYDNIRSQMSDNEVARAFFARAAMKGELKWDIQPFEEVFTPEQTNLIFKKINDTQLTATEHLQVVDAMSKLFFKGKIPTLNEANSLGMVLPRETINKLIDMRKRLGEKNYNLAIEALNIPRALLASYDLSAPLRQGLLMLFRNPGIWFRGVGHQLRAFLNPEYAEFMDMQIRTHPLFKQLQKSGLVLTNVGGLVSGEEMFRSDLAAKIPGVGTGIKASERAYVTFLNYVRAMNFYNVSEQWQGQGHSEEDYKQLAAYLNHATGRGDVKSLRKIMPALSVIMFAPRLTIGRVQVFSDLITKPAVRRMIAGDLLKFSSTAIGLLVLASLRKGIDVEWNPKSPDFAKVKIGNTRLDFLGGYQQIIRYTAQVITGEGKSTATGRLEPTERAATLWRFMQSKLSPSAMLAVDAVRGETFLGEQLYASPEVISREIYQRLVPMFIQDVVDVAKDRGLDKTAIGASLLALHGIGAQTYPVSPAGEGARLRDKYAMEYSGRRWDELGPDIQGMIKEYHPDIELMQAKARLERENTGFLQRMVKEQDAVSRRIHNSLPKNIQNEMDRLYVKIPGLSRRVGMDWYLNTERYKAYADGVSELLNKMLPQIMLNSSWNTLPDEARSMVLNDMVGEIKAIVRNKLMVQATLNDLQQAKPG